MKRILSALAVLVLSGWGLGPIQAANPEFFPIQQSPITQGTCPGPVGTGLCPTGVSPPTGYHFSLQIEDLFTQDSSIRTDLWACDYAADCYLNSDGLNLQPTAADTINNCAGTTARPCDAGLGSVFTPRFGYWEFSLRYPRGYDGTGDGYHIDTYVNNAAQGPGGAYEEVAVGGETIVGTSNSNIANFYCCTGDFVNADVAINSPTRFSDAFHIFGMLWFNDGSENGTQLDYLDGSPQWSRAHTVGHDWGTGNGGTIIMESVSCFTGDQVYDGGNGCSSSTATSGNPYTIQYFRYWSLVPN